MAAGPAGGGFHPHMPPLPHRIISKALGATMWFFIFYRARQDGSKLLGAHPFLSHDKHH